MQMNCDTAEALYTRKKLWQYLIEYSRTSVVLTSRLSRAKPMIPLRAVEGTETIACMRSPRLGELTAGISGVTEEK